MSSDPDLTILELLTFAPMVDSELSRLLLRHYRVEYRERNHLLAKASLLTLVNGGHGRIPLLHGEGIRLTSPRRIAEHFDPLAPADRRLMAGDGDMAQQVEADWRSYNDGLALATARFAYFHLLPLRELMSKVFAAPLPTHEAEGVRGAYPLLATLLRMLLRIGPEKAERALEEIRALFTLTDKRVEDGRPYLCGDRLTLGDLALAWAAAPLLLPPGYGARMPDVALMPSALRRVVGELRSRPTAAFVERLDAEGLAAGRVPA